MHIRIITYFVVKTLIFLYYLTLHIYIFYFLIKLRNTYGRNSIPQSNRKCENIGHLSLLEAWDPCLLIRKNVIHRKIVQSSIQIQQFLVSSQISLISFSQHLLNHLKVRYSPVIAKLFRMHFLSIRTVSSIISVLLLHLRKQ